MPHKVLIADNHAISRRNLHDVIENSGEFNVVAEVEDGTHALQALRKQRPEIALLDIDIPGIGGLGILAKTSFWAERPIFVLLAIHDDEASFHKALEFGALGYILKEYAESEIIPCLRMVSAGKHYISPSFSWVLAKKPPANLTLSTRLTPSERKILSFIAEYKTSAEIAKLMGTSVRTVQNHRANICSKLGLRGHNALIKLATQYR